MCQGIGHIVLTKLDTYLYTMKKNNFFFVKIVNVNHNVTKSSRARFHLTMCAHSLIHTFCVIHKTIAEIKNGFIGTFRLNW